MKKIYDFVYCDSVLSHDTVFYSVAVGRSERDKRALRSIQQNLQRGTYILSVHSEQFCQWLYQLEGILFNDDAHQKHYLRRLLVPVQWLATRIRTAPPSLLNSKRIHTPFYALQFCGTNKI